MQADVSVCSIWSSTVGLGGQRAAVIRADRRTVVTDPEGTLLKTGLAIKPDS